MPNSRLDYYEQIKKPKWQKRRLEILERDNWTCQDCGNKDETLNVHHKWYISTANIWDYPDEALITLCESCHHFEGAYRKEIEGHLLEALKYRGFLAVDIGLLWLAIDQMEYNGPLRRMLMALREVLAVPKLCEKMIKLAESSLGKQRKK